MGFGVGCFSSLPHKESCRSERLALLHLPGPAGAGGWRPPGGAAWLAFFCVRGLHSRWAKVVLGVELVKIQRGLEAEGAARPSPDGATIRRPKEKLSILRSDEQALSTPHTQL